MAINKIYTLKIMKKIKIEKTAVNQFEISQDGKDPIINFDKYWMEGEIFNLKKCDGKVMSTHFKQVKVYDFETEEPIVSTSAKSFDTNLKLIGFGNFKTAEATALLFYIGLLSQSSTNDPTVLSEQTNIADGITWSYGDSGQYIGTTTFTLETEKVIGFAHSGGDGDDTVTPFLIVCTGANTIMLKNDQGINGHAKLRISIYITP